VHHRGGGVEAARRVAAERAGGHLDPELVAVFADEVDEVLTGLDGASSWDSVIGAEPGLARVVRYEDLDGVLEAMADLVDMKSPYMAGHSRGVANLAAEAARVLPVTGLRLAANGRPTSPRVRLRCSDCSRADIQTERSRDASSSRRGRSPPTSSTSTPRS